MSFPQPAAFPAPAATGGAPPPMPPMHAGGSPFPPPPPVNSGMPIPVPGPPMGGSPPQVTAPPPMGAQPVGVPPLSLPTHQEQPNNQLPIPAPGQSPQGLPTPQAGAPGGSPPLAERTPIPEAGPTPEMPAELRVRNGYTYPTPHWVQLYADVKNLIDPHVKSLQSIAICDPGPGSAHEAALYALRNAKNQALDCQREAQLWVQRVYPEVPEDEMEFWMADGARDTIPQELIDTIDKCIKAVESSGDEKLGDDRGPGLTGVQENPLPGATETIRRAALVRRMVEDSAGVPRDTPGSASRELYNDALHTTPHVNANFLEETEETRPYFDPTLLKQADRRLEDPSLSVDPEMLRSVSITVNQVRLDQHPSFVNENSSAAMLLSAFEQYKLLRSNHGPGGRRSRHYYKQLQGSVHNRAGAMDALGEGARGHERRGSDDPRSEAAIIERMQKAEAEERELLQQMVNANFALRQEKAKISDAAAAAMAANGGKPAPSAPEERVHINLIMRHRERPEVEYQATDDILDFEPELSYGPKNEIIPVPGSKTNPPTVMVRAWAKTGSSDTLELVGGTEERHVDSTFTAVFNETIEMLTTQEPSEIMLQVLVDRTDVASVSIPTSRRHTAHLLPFGAAQSHGVTAGALSLATNWVTASGMTIADIENLFLHGTADPRDPANEQYVRQLREHYAENDPDVAVAAADGDETKSRSTKRRGSLASLQSPLGRRQSTLGGSSALSTSAFDEGATPGGSDGKPPLKDISLRLHLLNRRWKLQIGEDNAISHAEALLVNEEIPADERGCRRLMNRLKHHENDENDPDAHLKGWQARLRNLKLTQRKRGAVPDHELLTRYVALASMPSVGRIVERLTSWIMPTSKLNPKREPPPEAADIDREKLKEKKGNSQINVHILKVENLPLRRDGTQLEPFVTAEFINEFGSTRTETGSNPSYFERLSLDFQPLDFEEETLSLIDDDVVIAVYDQIQTSLPPATVVQGAEVDLVHRRIERRLLGLVKIPFYTLHQSPTASVEGQFNIVTPRWVVGYMMGAYPPIMQVYVSLWPPLSKKEEDRESDVVLRTKVELLPVDQQMQAVHQRALKWRAECGSFVRTVTAQNPIAQRREIEPFVPGSQSSHNLICLYMLHHGAKPPKCVTSIPEAIRFVSMIPFVVDMLAWNDVSDVWSTNQQYIEMGAGDYEEMAMLLVHYIRYFSPESQSFLVLGEGDVYKQATYVLFLSDQWKLVDPRTGDVFDARDPRCGFSEVGMVVSHDQVWGNIQPSGSPNRMDWNLRNTAAWHPLFENEHRDFAAVVDRYRLQTPTLTYGDFDDEQEMLEVQSKMEIDLLRAVKSNLKRWRNNKTPTYQSEVGTRLRQVLRVMEDERRENANYQQSAVAEEHDRLRDEMGIWRVVGVPVNCPYSDEDFENMMLLVRETAVHEVGTDDLKFAVGVYVQPFLKKPLVCSMWVYLLALVRKDT